ncbi:unnamed protein product [Owenia fusiformis]|uniref:Large ribosomal subunit protein mL64 n=1 Tax=Owenia fusiformis TaxID=6347 RepID=A0A8S4N3V8_OWEFU|nr:unnamed protein product [Owenia fusiformis]
MNRPIYKMAMSMVVGNVSKTIRFYKTLTSKSNDQVCKRFIAPVVKCYSSDSKEPVVIHDELDTDENIELENRKENEQVKDISGLLPRKRNMMKHVNQTNEIDETRPWEKLVREQRRRFAKYGFSSEVHPGYCWPSKETFVELKEIDKIFEPPIEERISQMKAAKKAKQDKYDEKMADIEKKMAEMPKHIEKYRQKLQKQGEEKIKQAEKRQKLLDEAREFYGYEVSASDAKFKLMLETKEAEEKARRKKMRKEKKEQMFLKSLEGMNKTKESKDNQEES